MGVHVQKSSVCLHVNGALQMKEKLRYCLLSSAIKFKSKTPPGRPGQADFMISLSLQLSQNPGKSYSNL